jgi:hypothetical protein
VIARLATASAGRNHPAYGHLLAGRYLRARDALAGAGKSDALWTQNTRLWTFLSIDPWGSDAWALGGEGEDIDVSKRALTRLEEGLRRAFEGRRVVIIQERHPQPETHWIGPDLIRILESAGATHFAFETFASGPLEKFERTGILRSDTAVYSFEPGRAGVLRAARKAGLKPVAFDFPPEGLLLSGLKTLVRRDARLDMNRKREIDMAENLTRLLVRDRRARVVVWTGEQHAMRKTSSWFPYRHPFMARNLAERIGEEPYCIGQLLVRSEEQPDELPALLTEDHPWIEERGLDVAIVHLRGSSPHMPAWLKRSRTEIRVPADGALLVKAVPRNEGARAVPADMSVLKPGDQEVSLVLEPGSYQLIGAGTSDQVLWSRMQEVA